MKSVTKVTSTIAAVGAAVLGVGLISLGTGVGAQFTDTGTANAHIKTGTFGCQLSSSDTSVVISNGGHTATVDLGTVTSSAASSKSAPVTVTNTGTIALATTWSETTTGNLLGAFTAIPAAAGAQLAAGGTQTVHIGFQWTALTNSDLNRAGTAQYTVNCGELPSTQIVRSSTLNFAGDGWGGWSCPTGKQIVSATAEEAAGGTGNGTVASLTLWRPGASVGSVNYPNTPFGYTYAANEQGAIAQNDGDTGETIVLVLTCTA